MVRYVGGNVGHGLTGALITVSRNKNNYIIYYNNYYYNNDQDDDDDKNYSRFFG